MIYFLIKCKYASNYNDGTSVMMTSSGMRVCTLCGQSIGDEFHLLFVCCNEYLVNLRRLYLPRYYVTYPSIVKMNGLLSFCNVEVYKRLFIKKIAGMF
jgi:hypothetical protein